MSTLSTLLTRTPTVFRANVTSVPCYLIDGTSIITCDVPTSTPTSGEFAGMVLVIDGFPVRATITCEGTYVLTAEDIDSLETAGTATVQGVDGLAKTVTDETTTTVILDQVKRFVATSTFDRPGAGGHVSTACFCIEIEVTHAGSSCTQHDRIR